MANTFLQQQGFMFDETSQTYYKTIGNYNIFITNYMSNQYYINVSVFKDSPIIQDEIKQFVKDTKTIRQFNTQGNRISFLVKSGFTKKKTDENLAEALNALVIFLSENGYKQCLHFFQTNFCNSTFYKTNQLSFKLLNKPKSCFLRRRNLF